MFTAKCRGRNRGFLYSSWIHIILVNIINTPSRGAQLFQLIDLHRHTTVTQTLQFTESSLLVDTLWFWANVQ